MKETPQDRLAKIQAEISAQKDLLNELSEQRRVARCYTNCGGFDIGNVCAKVLTGRWLERGGRAKRFDRFPLAGGGD